MKKLEANITKVSYHFYRLLIMGFHLIGVLGIFWGLAIIIYGGILKLSAIHVTKGALLLVLSILLSSGSADILERLPDRWSPLDKKRSLLRLLDGR